LARELRARASGELPSRDVSALYDFGVLYENARRMRPMPMGLNMYVVALMMVVVLLFLPLVFLVMPAQEDSGRWEVTCVIRMCRSHGVTFRSHEPRSTGD
jgi:hypothetical protein